MRIHRTVILGAAAVVLVAGALLMYVRMPHVFARQVEEHLDHSEYAEAIDAQQRLVDLFPRHEVTRDSVGALASALAFPQDELLLIANGFSSGPAAVRLDPELMRTLIDHALATARREPRTRERLWLLQRTAGLLWRAGQEERALEQLDYVIEQLRLRGWSSTEAALTRLRWMTDDTNRLAHARVLLERTSESRDPGERHFVGTLLVEVGDSARALGLWAEAQEAYARALVEFEQWAEQAAEGETEPASYFLRFTAYDRAAFGLSHAEFALQSDPGNVATVTGSISGIDTSQRVTVVLTPGLQSAPRHSRTSTRAEWYRSLASDDGTFLFRALPPGDYTLYLELAPHLLRGVGKITMPEHVSVRGGEEADLAMTFRDRIEVLDPKETHELGPSFPFVLETEWVPVTGASYYEVKRWTFGTDEAGEIDGGIGWVVEPRVTEPEFANRVSYGEAWYSPGPSYNEGVLTPQSVVGSIVPGGVLSLSITAYGEDEKVLTSSDGYVAAMGRGERERHALYEVPDSYELFYGPLSQAARAVAQGEYERAIAAFEKAIQEEVDGDLEKRWRFFARLALWRLYSYATEPRASSRRSDRLLEELAELAKGELELTEALGWMIEAPETGQAPGAD